MAFTLKDYLALVLYLGQTKGFHHNKLHVQNVLYMGLRDMNNPLIKEMKLSKYGWVVKDEVLLAKLRRFGASDIFERPSMMLSLYDFHLLLKQGTYFEPYLNQQPIDLSILATRLPEPIR